MNDTLYLQNLRNILLTALITGLAVSAPVWADSHGMDKQCKNKECQEFQEEKKKRAARATGWKERRAKRFQKLKEVLKIRSDQETAWEKFNAAMKPDPKKMDKEERRKRFQEFKKLTTPERLAKMEERHATRSTQMQHRREAIRNFYAQLDTDQQKIFDKHSMRFGAMGHGGQQRKFRGRKGDRRGGPEKGDRNTRAE